MSLKPNNSSRVSLFIDGSYLYLISNYYQYHEQNNLGRISFEGMHKEIEKIISDETGVESSIVSGNYYRFRHNAKKANEIDVLYVERVIDDALRNLRYNINYYPSNRRDHQQTCITLDAYKCAESDDADIIVFIVSNAAYAPLIDAIKKMNKKVVVLYWDFSYQKNDGEEVVTKASYELINSADLGVDMIKYISIEKDNNIFLNKGEDIPEDGIISGHVSKLPEKEKYGFIEYFINGDSDSIFFHANDITNFNFNKLKEGDTVNFMIGHNDELNKPKAVNVTVI